MYYSLVIYCSFFYIQTDQSVDTNDIDVHRVMVVTERLMSLYGTDLVAWTVDKYGPPVSYNEIVMPANYFDLTVDGGGMTAISDTYNF